ncbi:hypothetical protein I312_103645 [Cryptococcus bacillisporus CA1280]|uniref:uncharacterized protein n=1 Tax=Cryptococcus bacillisporus CA1280 TaxID=1296109 RepID=UPI003366557C
MLNLESFGLSSLFSVEGKPRRGHTVSFPGVRTVLISRLPGDVGSKDKVDAIVTALEKLEDHVDVLINCAGVNRAWKEEAAKFDNQHNDPDAVEKLLWHGLDDNEFQSTYSINVNGVYFFSTRMVPLLRKGTAPTVIVIASITAMMLQRTVGALTYPISKVSPKPFDWIADGQAATIQNTGEHPPPWHLPIRDDWSVCQT